jgi:hypothetical protein
LITLEWIITEWGEWYDDDYVWSATSESSNIETKLVAESGLDSSETRHEPRKFRRIFGKNRSRMDHTGLTE